MTTFPTAPTSLTVKLFAAAIANYGDKSIKETCLPYHVRSQISKEKKREEKVHAPNLNLRLIIRPVIVSFSLSFRPIGIL